MTQFVLLGTSVGDDTAVAYNRKSPFNHTILNYENAVQGALGNPSFRAAANRRHYLFFNEVFPPNSDNARGRLADDFAQDRLPVLSFKMGTGTWVDAGNAAPGATGSALTAYNNIRARGQEVAAMQGSRTGVGRWGGSFLWYFHHEPNSAVDEGGGGATTYAQSGAHWRAAVQNIIAIWQSVGVKIGSVDNDGRIVNEGVLIGALNLTWGPSMNGTPDDFMPTSWTWGNANVTFISGDSYNRRPAGAPPTGIFNSFQNGFTWGPNALKPWVEARQAYLGRRLWPCILETNTEERSFYGTSLTEWNATTGGIEATKANWYLNALAYVRNTWSSDVHSSRLFTLCFWDAIGSFDFRTDSTAAAWTAWLQLLTDPVWVNYPPATPPPPPSSEFIGAVSAATRVRMSR